tara:strand:+ start:767 stop:1042 length:276 start_codon:yes stop_codon:yes gene_type:complete
MLKKGKKRSNEGQIRENMVKLDEISEQFYAENKEKRGKVYLEWLKKVKQTSDIIKENEGESLYFLGNELEVACINDSSGKGLEKSRKSNEK